MEGHPGGGYLPLCRGAPGGRGGARNDGHGSPPAAFSELHRRGEENMSKERMN